MNYGIVVEFDHGTDLMPWRAETLEEAEEMRERYLSVFSGENYIGARRVYVIVGERVEVI